MHHKMSAAAPETPQDAIMEEEISGPAQVSAVPKETKRNACISSLLFLHLG
jgi:hypothetical protein